MWSPAVLVSLLVGAATHSAWDSFTHGGNAGVGEWLPVIETRLFTVSGYTAYVFSVLQHLSSVVGMIVLGLWTWRWYGRAPEAGEASGGLSPHMRRSLLVAIAVVALTSAGAAAAVRPPAEITLRHLQPVVRRVVVSGLTALVVAVTMYAVGWHWTRRRV